MMARRLSHRVVAIGFPTQQRSLASHPHYSKIHPGPRVGGKPPPYIWYAEADVRAVVVALHIVKFIVIQFSFE